MTTQLGLSFLDANGPVMWARPNSLRTHSFEASRWRCSRSRSINAGTACRLPRLVPAEVLFHPLANCLERFHLARNSFLQCDDVNGVRARQRVAGDRLFRRQRQSRERELFRHFQTFGAVTAERFG